MERIAIVGLGQMGSVYVKTLLGLGFSQEDLVCIDTDDLKFKAAMEQWPKIKAYHSVLEASFEGVSAAIVATNTPSHHRIIIYLLSEGVRYIFCEKPLGIDLQVVADIEEAVKIYGGVVYTAFLINFSEAVYELRKMMMEKGLRVVEGYVNWGKDRTGNSRPTPGDLEDEACHGAGAIHSLTQVNQRIRGMEVFGRTSFLPYVDRDVQKKACDSDASFLLVPNASSFITEIVETNEGTIHFGIHSSYLNIKQERTIHITLSDVETGIPKYLAQMEFDTSEGDVLAIKVPGKKETKRFVFKGDKVGAEIVAFLDAVSNQEPDPRLTDLDTAKLAVKFSDAVKESHLAGKFIPI